MTRTNAHLQSQKTNSKIGDHNLCATYSQLQIYENIHMCKRACWYRDISVKSFGYSMQRDTSFYLSHIVTYTLGSCTTSNLEGVCPEEAVSWYLRGKPCSVHALYCTAKTHLRIPFSVIHKITKIAFTSRHCSRHVPITGCLQGSKYSFRTQSSHSKRRFIRHSSF